MLMLTILGSLSWTFVGPEGGDILSVASDDAGHVLASGFSVAYYSSDSGLTWTRIDIDGYEPLPGFIRGYKVDILGSRLLLFHSDGVLYSDDGSVWNSMSFPDVRFVADELGGSIVFISENSLYYMNENSLMPAVAFSLPADTVLIAAASYDSLWYAFARADSDTVIVFRGTPDTVELRGAFAYNGDIIDVAINPFNPDEVFISVFGGMLSSTDGGASFSQVIGAMVSGVFVPTDIDFVGADSIAVGSFYFAGGYIGVRSGFFGWSFSQVYSDAIVRDIDGSYIAAVGRGVVYTPDGGNTFEERNDGLYAHTLFNPGMVSNTRTDRLSFINFGGLSFYTTDGGTTWNNYGYKMDIGYSIEVAPYDPDVIYIGGYRNNGNFTNPRAIVLVRSSDGGSSFSTVRDTTPDAYYAMPMEIQAGSDPARVFLVHYGWNMEFSPDSGNTTVQVMTANDYYGFCFSCVDTLFMVVDSGVLYASYDAGESWDSLTTLDFVGDVYLTYYDGIVYYTTGADAYVRAYNLSSGQLDSIDLSSMFSSVKQVQFSLNGHVFLTGYTGTGYKIAYGSSFDNLTLEDAPSENGGVLPLGSYVYFYSPYDGGFYSSEYPVQVAEQRADIGLVYTRNGIRVQGCDEPVYVYSVKGSLVGKFRDFVPYNKLKPGAYIFRVGERSYKILRR